MSRHTRWLAVLLILGTLAAVGVSLLFAASPTPRYDVNSSGLIENHEAYEAVHDYFDGTLTQPEVLDVLLQYWGDVPVSTPPPSRYQLPTPTPTVTPTPIPTPTPTPTPIPTATPTPTPIPGPLPMLTICSSRVHSQFQGPYLWWNTGGKKVVEQVSKHIDVTFLNNRPDWNYGFRLVDQVLGDYSYGHIEITSEGEWILKKVRSGVTANFEQPRIVDSGYLDASVPLRIAEGERNQLTFYAPHMVGGFGKGPSLYVNGVKVEDIHWGRAYRYEQERYESSRRYYLYSNTVIQPYENLCTVNS